MAKRIICLVFAITLMFSNIVFAEVPKGYPSELNITADSSDKEIVIYFDGKNGHLGFSGTTPLVVNGGRDNWLNMFHHDDVNAPDFFTAYSAEEYLSAFNKIKDFENKEFSDIYKEDIRDYVKGLCKGGIPQGYGEESSSVYLKDCFLIAAIDRLGAAQNMSNSEYSKIDNSLINNYTPGNLFFIALGEVNPMFKGASSLLDIKLALERKSNANKEIVVKGLTDTFIYNEYVSKISPEVANSMHYEDITKVLYALSWSNLNRYPAFSVIQESLGLSSFNQEELLEAYWNKVKRSYIAEGNEIRSDALMQLAYIIHGRESLYSLDNKGGYGNIPPCTDPEESADINAKMISQQIASNALNTLRSMPSSAVTTEKQFATIDYRLQYHYYAMQSSPSNISGIQDINYLSKTESGSVFSRIFKPLVLERIGLIQETEYIMFMNVVNELPYLKQTLLSATPVTSGSKPNSEVIRNARYIRQLKGAVSFLESLPYISVKEVTQFWYDKSSGKSLQDLFIETQELNLDEAILDSNVTEEDKHPMSSYFNIKDSKLNLYLKMGIAQSALFMPLQTNVYEPYSYASITNEKFNKELNLVWGYHRKVLYIDTALSSAVNLHNTDRSGKLRPATLKDLLSPEKDIVLYTDTTFYNKNKLETMEDKVLNVYDESKEKIEETKETVETTKDAFGGRWGKVMKKGLSSVTNLVTDLVSSSYDSIVKQLTPYSQTLAENWKMDLKKFPLDDSVLNGVQIKQYLKDPVYSELKTFAVQSAILRDSDLVNMYIKKYNSLPVFVSSKNLCKLKNISETEKNSFFNYLLLKNIEPNIKVEYKSTMDYNSLVYMDIYGNILTESGYVVVPAMANGTLQKAYSPYTNAFLSSYGKVYKAPKSYKNVMDTLGDIMELSDDEKSYEFKVLVEGNVIDFQHLSPNSEATQKRFYNLARSSLEMDNWQVPKYVVNVLLEVMRGAPLEFIDKEAESFKVSERVSKAGVVQAVKLDNLKEALNTNSQNSVIAIPNLAFMNGVEYVILFVYKITMLAVVLLIFIQIFSMAMTGSINLYSIGKILLTIGLTFTLIFAVPVIYETTYYQTNKALLQKEATSIALLNLEKEENGTEIGMTGVGEPKSDTKLFLKMQKIDMPWTDLFGEVIYSSIDRNMSKIYEDYARSSMAYGLDNFQAKGDGTYLDVMDLFKSSSVVFDFKFMSIYQYTKDEIPASFYSPYYVILDSLIGNVNKFNATNNLYSFTSSFFKGGKLKSVGLIKEYLYSDLFMLDTSKDNLHLKQIYSTGQGGTEASPFTMEDINKMKKSYWYNDKLTSEEVELRIEKLNKSAKSFVLNNKALIGRISDESFLKVMALSLAMEHNKLFGVDSAQTLELYNLSPDDLVRLSILPKDSVMKGSIYSYSRYIFEYVGTIGVYLAAILDMVLFVGGWVKPAITLLIFIILYVSIFINRLILRKDSDNLKGYIRLVILLSLTNLMYSLVLKISTMLPRLGLPPAVCLVALIVFHMSFIAAFVWITSVAVLNWRDLGNSNFQVSQLEVREFIVGNSVYKRIEERLSNPTNSGWEFYKMLHTNDKERVYKIDHDSEI